jgi:TRAP-type C4-dicarboxylate transport system permease large subunit
MGLVTPPVGAVLFVGAAVSGLKMERVVRTAPPFPGAMFLVLMAVTYLPSITLLIPWLSGLVTDPQMCAATSLFGCP